MILTFKELKLDKASYNGISYAECHSAIVNIACDYVMRHFFAGMVEEECIISPSSTFVNFILEVVELETISPLAH